MIIESGGPVFYATCSRTYLPLGFERFSMRSHLEHERRRTLMLYIRRLFVFSSSCYAYGFPETLVLGSNDERKAGGLLYGILMIY
jgi:hypothetical protein